MDVLLYNKHLFANTPRITTRRQPSSRKPSWLFRSTILFGGGSDRGSDRSVPGGTAMESEQDKKKHKTRLNVSTNQP